MGDLFVVPSPREDGYLELARTASGKLFRKQILRMGQSFVHPKDKKVKITVTPDMANRMVENFHRGYCDTVQFPITDESNAHTENVLSNLGEVIDVEANDKGVYAIIDARKHAEDVGKTILGASAFFSLNYTDTETGKPVGPTLLHVAATNRPYLTKLEPYEAVVAASNSSDRDVVLLSDDGSDDSVPDDSALADTSDSDPDDAEEQEMTLEEMLATLKEEHGIDVPALQASAAQLDDAQQQLETLGLSADGDGGEGITNVDIAEALVELSNTVKSQGETIAAQQTTNEQLVRERAEAEVDGLIDEGRILPKQRDTMIKLSLSDREAFDSLVPENPVVSLSEDGVTVFEEPEKAKEHDETVDRYVALAASSGARPARKRRGAE